MGGPTPNLVLTSLRGRSHLEARLHIEFLYKDNNTEWKTKKKVYERYFPIHQAPNVYNYEVIGGHALFTDEHPSNKVVSLFGSVFLALDWTNNATIQVFQTYKELSIDHKMDLVEATPDNQLIVMYSSGRHQLLVVTRDKDENEHVMEEW